MEFQMKTEQRDWLGQSLELGDLVVTLDPSYGTSGGDFSLGVVAGSTPKMVKIATPSYGDRINFANRNTDKLIKISGASVSNSIAQMRYHRIAELLDKEGFPMDELEQL